MWRKGPCTYAGPKFESGRIVSPQFDIATASQMVVCDFGLTLLMAWFGVQVAGYRLKGQQFPSQEFDFLWPLARALESREAAPLKCKPQVVDEREAMGLVLE